jgi:hypothetical protein
MALVAFAPALAGAADVHDALRAGELICEFKAGYKRSVIADMLGDVQPVEQMLVYEAVGRDSAQVVSTRAPGRMPVEVRSTGAAVHFIERKGPSVLVTTLTRCERTKWKKGEEVCVRFAARHAWHFDLLALKEPDASLARQPSGALRGVCEPWQLD